MNRSKVVIGALLAILAGVANADECRELSHAKRAHVFVITDSDGPVYGYAELADVMKAWKSTQTNWTKTIQGRSVEEVRAKLAEMMRDDVIANPRPPRLVPIDLFGPSVEWGEIDDDRKSVYNVSKWAPMAKNPSWKRTWTLSSTRD